MNDYPIELRYNLGPPVIILDQNTNLYDIIHKEVSTSQIDGRSFPSFFIKKNTIQELLEYGHNNNSSSPQSNNESPTGGFIKTKWVLDTCYNKPSVICYCIEPNRFNEFTNEILNELENIKYVSRSHYCHLLIIIKSAIDMNSDEFSSMKKKIGIDSKYILQFSLKNISDSMKILENMLRKASNEHFYSLTVKAKKEKAKTQQTHVQTIRMHFKLGFYHEKRNDLKHAFTQYQLSYNSLKNFKKTWKKLEEIRTIADLLNFKMCNILFIFNKVLDGIDQFQKHIDIYKNITGDPNKEFTHYAFLARQYQIFGELLEYHSIHTNTDSMTRMPGYYYMIAANLLKQRREYAIKLCYNYRSDKNIKSLMDKVEPYKPCYIDLQQQEFVGEVADIHQFMNKDDPLQNNPTLEDAKNVLIAQELKVDHGKLILELLNRASCQFKKLRSCKRLTWYLSSVMADEYKRLKFFDIAKKHYDEIINFYKKDNWNRILASILSDALYCSFQLKLYPDIIKYSLDLLDPKIILPQTQKVKIMEDMLNYINNRNTEIEKPIRIPISYDSKVFEKKISFRNVKVHMNENFKVRLVFSSNLPSKIVFNSISLQFNIPEYNKILKDSEYLSFEPYEKKVIEIEMNAIKIGDLYCESIHLEYGDNYVIFECDNNIEVESQKKCNKDVITLTILEIKPDVILTVKENSPALLGEKFPIQFIFENKGIPVERGILIIEGVKKQLLCLYHERIKDKTPRFDLQIGPINSDSTLIETIYFCSKLPEPLEINVTFRYYTKEYSTKTEYQHIVIPVIKPLEIKSDIIYKYKHLLSSKEKIYIGDIFFVNVDATPFSDIHIVDVKLVPNEISNNQYLIDLKSSSFKENEVVHLTKSNQFNVLFSVQAINNGIYSPGNIIIKWKRSEEYEPTISKFELPSITVHKKRDYDVTIHCTNGTKGEVIDHKIVVKNMTGTIQEYLLELANTSCFVVSGVSKVRFKVNPYSHYETVHKLFPTKHGRVQTPTFYLKHEVNDIPILLNSLSQYIFVFPS